ncbi:MAG: hypothetical protein ICV68_05150 [Pyrinomonadaceae bacterium]|nr:hypothetical protein [Pyrinomonadaceae bacterium]
MRPFRFPLASLACLLAGISFIFACGLLAHAATKRDHLTELEAEQVRAAQILDKRIEVFIKIAERRLLALSDPNAATNKQVQKDVEKWGELPKGTRTELFHDLAKILDEAITNIDDVAARDANNRLLPKALRKLSAASTRFISQLTPMRTQAKDETEREALEQALENAQSIVEAANRLPPEVKEEKEKDKKKTEKNKS